MTYPPDERAAPALDLMPGDVVEVRSREEILATLDIRASVDGLPFMPEMLEFCGRTLTVYRRADKTCDTIDGTGARRMHRTVHLQDARCDGSKHGGCQAGCLMFWKEEWLRKAGSGEPVESRDTTDQVRGGDDPIERGARYPAGPDDGDAVRFRCQITELKTASQPLPWWDLRQYFRDVRTGNTTAGKLPVSIIFAMYRKLTEIGFGYKLLISIYDRFQALRGGTPFPYKTGKLDKTPTGSLDLKPGEWVRVKSFDEILATLDKTNRNRGLYFDAEMVRFCGRTFPVHGSVTQILDERTGVMMHFKNPCIVLADVFCRGALSKGRLYCPRAIYSYWREIWLERVDPPTASGS